MGSCTTPRLCQEIVLLKADVSELLLPSIMVDLARRKDLDQNFHQLISLKVKIIKRLPYCILFFCFLICSLMKVS